MKKLILSFAVVAISLVSCKKDYSCTCTDTEVISGNTSTDTYSYKVEKASKTEAQAACNEATIIYTDGADSFTTKCELSK